MDDSKFPFRVVRRPSLQKLISLFRWADVVNLAGPALLPLALAWMFQRPSVLEHHGYQSICPNGLLVYEPDRSVCPGHYMAGRYQKCIKCNEKEMGWIGSIRNLCLMFPRRWLAKRATVNIGTSPHVALRTDLPRTVVIWNGVAQTPKPQKLNDNGSICFGYLGRLVTEKGLPVLLRASEALHRKGYLFRLRIVGDGPERGSLEKLAHEYGLSQLTEFVGSVPASAIPEALQGVSVIVMPSVCEDVAPLAAMEQMMEGRVLIGSDIGGLGILSKDGGITFPAGDSDSLESRMCELIENPSAIPEFGARCRQYAVETFSYDRMVREHAEIYASLRNLALKNELES